MKKYYFTLQMWEDASMTDMLADLVGWDIEEIVRRLERHIEKINK